MPYIHPRIRERIDAGEPPGSLGSLNYAATKMCLDYIGPFPTYADYNNVIGVLECVKLELYRRAVAPYEDGKLEENGDVYG